jgi:hypothetical protein
MLWGGNGLMPNILAILAALTSQAIKEGDHTAEEKAGIAMLFICSFVHSAMYGRVRV